MKKYINKLIQIFFIIQFIIDLLTAGSATNNSITVGVIVRTLFMIFVVIYGFINSNKKNRKKQLIYYGIIAIYCIIFIISMICTSGIGTIFSQIKGLIKTLYFPVILVALLNLSRENEIKIESNLLSYALFGYVLIILIAKISGTAFYSYPYRNNEGTTGWFFAANEIGNIIAMLFPITLLSIINNKGKKIILPIATILISIFALTEIGTKVPFFSFVISSLLIIIICIINIKKEKKFLAILISSILILIITFLCLNITPIGKNLEANYGIRLIKIFNREEPSTDEDKTAQKPNTEIDTTVALSNRNEFLKTNLGLYAKSNIINKLIGMGYIQEEQYIKAIEMDFFDILCFNGIIGIVVYFLPIGALAIEYIYRSKNNIKKLIKINVITLSYSCCLTLGISTLTGHALTSPAVSTFLAATIILLDENVNEVLKIGGKK